MKSLPLTPLKFLVGISLAVSMVAYVFAPIPSEAAADSSAHSPTSDTDDSDEGITVDVNGERLVTEAEVLNWLIERWINPAIALIADHQGDLPPAEPVDSPPAQPADPQPPADPLPPADPQPPADPVLPPPAQPVLALTSVSPGAGSTKGGYPVTITGTGFGDHPVVRIGDNTAEVSEAGATTLTVTVPAHEAGPAYVSVEAGGESVQLTDPFIYLGPPSITKVGPVTTGHDGFSIFSIFGTGFTAASAVTIGGVAATGVTVVSPTEIEVTVPSDGAGNGEVKVETDSGEANEPSEDSPDESDEDDSEEEDPNDADPLESDLVSYIVYLDSPPVVLYHGGISGYEATAPEAGEQFDPSSPGAARYSAYLAQEHRDLAAEYGFAIAQEFTVTFNGFSALLTSEQVSALVQNDEVLLLEPDGESEIE